MHLAVLAVLIASAGNIVQSLASPSRVGDAAVRSSMLLMLPYLGLRTYAAILLDDLTVAQRPRRWRFGVCRLPWLCLQERLLNA